MVVVVIQHHITMVLPLFRVHCPHWDRDRARSGGWRQKVDIRFSSPTMGLMVATVGVLVIPTPVTTTVARRGRGGGGVFCF